MVLPISLTGATRDLSPGSLVAAGPQLFMAVSLLSERNHNCDTVRAQRRCHLLNMPSEECCSNQEKGPGSVKTRMRITTTKESKKPTSSHSMFCVYAEPKQLISMGARYS
ncbi:hypothetical protein GDO81_006907 [Engystomops pustulosus]|uniref:Uncharacterized protein n=1 Tax=Engystomops pustulosus TaxID=76066 RepID=A0AAV7D058_ENGPU|nr:hypothetical protein GDO81_006907 [Engystomops pustulosus]